MKEIILSRGKVALVDDEDFELVRKHKWCCLKNGYAITNGSRTDAGGRKCIYLHRFILDVPKGKYVDHIDGDPLNNQRSNLRICTNAENSRNQRKMRAVKTSRFKGVSWHMPRNKWAATIHLNRKKIHLGLYTSEQAAAHAYDIAARKYHGEFAATNEVTHA